MKVKIEELAGGAASERLDQSLARVVQNIADPNTEAKKKRTITLKITFSPNEDRGVSVVDIDCTEKLAPYRPVVTAIFTGVNRRTGEVEAIEAPKQGELFPHQQESEIRRVK